MAADTALSALLSIVFVKGTVLLAGGALAHWAVRRAASRVVAVWQSVAWAMLALPLLAAVLPVWQVGSVEFPHSMLPAPLALLFLWLAGAAWLLLRFAGDYRAARRIVRDARTVSDARILRFFAIHVAEAVHGRVDLRISAALRSPAVVGWRRATLLLPVDAPGWSDADLNAAFAHEAEHLARNDWLLGAVERVVAALYWPNPLVHLAQSTARFHRELAADDAVLSAGTDAEAYAACMIRVARLARASGTALAQSERRALVGAGAAAFSMTAGLERRVFALFDESRDRRGLRPRALHVASSGMTLVAAVAAAATFWVCV